MYSVGLHKYIAKAISYIESIFGQFKKKYHVPMMVHAVIVLKQMIQLLIQQYSLENPIKNTRC